MQRTNKSECPHCLSTDVSDTGNRAGNVQNLHAGQKIKTPNNPIFHCNKCNKNFVIEV